MTDRERLATLVRQHGWAATCTQALNPGLEIWTDDGSAVAYRRVPTRPGGRFVRVTAGEPVSPASALERAQRAFEADAARHGEGVIWFGVERLDRLAGDRARLVIGAQPVWAPSGWDAMVAASASVRAQRNRALNKQVEVQEWPSGRVTQSPEVHAILSAWLSTRGLPPLGFLTDPLVLDHLGDRRVWVATRASQPIAYAVLAPIPAREGWLVEWLVRRREAPNGTAAMLLDTAVRTVADEGARYVTLGLVPLARHAPPTHGLSSTVRATLRWARAHGRRFYDFEGLERFKAKFRPDRWDPVWLLTTEPQVTLFTLYAVAGAFSRDLGTIHLVGRALGGAVASEARAVREVLSWSPRS